MDWKTFEKYMKEYPKWWRYAYFAILCLCHGCTYSIIMNHTEGSATDSVETDQEATAHVSPKITLPLDH